MPDEKGVLLFAYDNESISYTNLAIICALLVRKHLPGTGIALVTNNPVDGPFDDIIHVDAGNSGRRTFRNPGGELEELTWHNKTRPLAYDLSPFQKTLLLDVDYLMFNNSLQGIFQTQEELVCHKDVFDITGMNSFIDDKLLHWSSIPMLWATVLYFTKGETAKAFFDLMKMIQENYMYYYNLYNFKKGPYRNDYAISIAYNLLSLEGYFDNSLLTLPSQHTLTDVREDGTVVYEFDNNVSTAKNANLHIMNKHSILENANNIIRYATQPTLIHTTHEATV